jgi:hypothetical protein
MMVQVKDTNNPSTEGVGGGVTTRAWSRCVVIQRLPSRVQGGRGPRGPPMPYAGPPQGPYGPGPAGMYGPGPAGRFGGRGRGMRARGEPAGRGRMILPMNRAGRGPGGAPPPPPPQVSPYSNQIPSCLLW